MPPGPPPAPQGSLGITEPIGASGELAQSHLQAAVTDTVCSAHITPEDKTARLKADVGLAAGSHLGTVAPGVGRHFFGNKEGKLRKS